MKTWRFGCGLLLLAGSVGALPPRTAASPLEQDVRAAADSLWRADNYAWEHLRETASGASLSGRGFPLAAGATEVRGVTASQFTGHRVVLYRGRVAFELEGGWRLASELTDDDIADLSAGHVGTIRRTRKPRTFALALPHELLRWLMTGAGNYRQDGGSIAADLDDSVVSYSDVMRCYDEGAAPGSHGLLGMILPHPMVTLRVPRVGATLRVVITGGEIEEFSVERSVARSPTDANPASEVSMIFRTKLSKLGHANVDAPTEVRLLLHSPAP